MRAFILIIMTAFLLSSCISSKVNAPGEYMGDIVTIGSGGGVTGQWTTWYLLSNGQLFRQEGISGTTNFIRKLSKKETKECFDLILTPDLQGKSFSHPGNMTFVLGLKHESNTWEVKWGENGIKPPSGFESAYAKIITVINH